MPNQIATDNFNRANGALGTNWTTGTGSFAITSNAVQGTGASHSVADWNANAFGVDQYSELTVTGLAAGGFIGPAVRVSGGNCYTYRVSQGQRLLSVFPPNADLVTISSGASVGDVLRLEVSGNQLRAYRNGVLDASATDSTNTSGPAGIYGFGNTLTFGDNWAAGNLGTLSGYQLISGPVTALGANNVSQAMDTTGATLLVAAIGTISGDTAPFISDSASNTWTGLTAKSSGTAKCQIFYVLNPTTSARHTFTALGTDTTFVVWAFSGNAPAPVDQQNGNNGPLASPFQPGSCGISKTGGLVIAVADSNAIVATCTMDSGFNSTFIAGGAANEGVCGGYLISTGQASVNPTFTASGATDWCTAIASFLPGGGLLDGGGLIQQVDALGGMETGL